MLPAYRVRARIGTHRSSVSATVRGERTLTICLPRPLRAGRHTLRVDALGLTARRLAFRVGR
jgi:hypothetical protein